MTAHSNSGWARVVLEMLLPRLTKEGRVAIVLVADTEEDGTMAYASTADREDSVTAIIEWLGHVEPAMLKNAMRRWQLQQTQGPERTQ